MWSPYYPRDVPGVRNQPISTSLPARASQLGGRVSEKIPKERAFILLFVEPGDPIQTSLLSA